jgi:hypothetical protein
MKTLILVLTVVGTPSRQQVHRFLSKVTGQSMQWISDFVDLNFYDPDGFSWHRKPIYLKVAMTPERYVALLNIALKAENGAKTLYATGDITVELYKAPPKIHDIRGASDRPAPRLMDKPFTKADVDKALSDYAMMDKQPQ